MTDDALGEDDACGLLDRLARRETSPEELLAAAVARAHAVNDRLNAVTAWVPQGTASRDLPQAPAPFAGIPTVIKDNEPLAGLPTSQGSWALPDTPAADSGSFRWPTPTMVAARPASRPPAVAWSASSRHEVGWSTGRSFGTYRCR